MAVEAAVQQVRDKLHGMLQDQFLQACEDAAYQVRPPANKEFPRATGGKLMISEPTTAHKFLQEVAWDYERVRDWVIDDVCQNAHGKPDQFAGFCRVLKVAPSDDRSREGIADGVNGIASGAKRHSKEDQRVPWYCNAGHWLTIIGIVVGIILTVVTWMYFT